jgi:hypothetical protein
MKGQLLRAVVINVCDVREDISQRFIARKSYLKDFIIQTLKTFLLNWVKLNEKMYFFNKETN